MLSSRREHKAGNGLNAPFDLTLCLLADTQLAVANNDRLGIDSYEGENGQIVVRKAGQTRPTH